jgi:hypothetical protein
MFFEKQILCVLCVSVLDQKSQAREGVPVS